MLCHTVHFFDNVTVAPWWCWVSKRHKHLLPHQVQLCTMATSHHNWPWLHRTTIDHWLLCCALWPYHWIYGKNSWQFWLDLLDHNWIADLPIKLFCPYMEHVLSDGTMCLLQWRYCLFILGKKSLKSWFRFLVNSFNLFNITITV